MEDVAPHGHAVDQATVRQKKTGRTVGFEMTEQTREAVDGYIGAVRFTVGSNRLHACGAGYPDIEPAKSPAEPMVRGLAAGGESHERTSL